MCKMYKFKKFPLANTKAYSSLTIGVGIDILIMVQNSYYSKLKFKLDHKSLETIYIAFIRPLLEYGDVIWDDCT